MEPFRIVPVWVLIFYRLSRIIEVRLEIILLECTGGVSRAFVRPTNAVLQSQFAIYFPAILHKGFRYVKPELAVIDPSRLRHAGEIAE